MTVSPIRCDTSAMLVEHHLTPRDHLAGGLDRDGVANVMCGETNHRLAGPDPGKIKGQGG